jgi:hypothetical protein
MDINIVFVAQTEAHAGSVNDLAFSYPTHTTLCCNMSRGQGHQKSVYHTYLIDLCKKIHF